MGGLISCFKGHENNSDPDEIISPPPQRQYQTNAHIRTERENLRERPYEYNSNVLSPPPQWQYQTNTHIRTERENLHERPYEYNSNVISPPSQRQYQTNTHIRTERENLHERPYEYNSNVISPPPQRQYQTNAHIRTERENLRERPYEYNSAYIRTLQNQHNLRNLEEENRTRYRDALLAPATTYSYGIDTDLPAGCKKLSPSEIYYTQDSIATTFYERGRHGGVKLGQTLDDLLRNRVQINNIPRITVCWYEQQWFSLDNRRLWVLKNYEKIKGKIQIIVHVTMSMDEDKFTTMNNGKSIRVRGDPGGSYWKTFKMNRNQ